MNTIEDKKKKIYSCPMIETEHLLGEILQVESLPVVVNPKQPNDYQDFVSDFDELLAGESSLWDEEEE